MESVLLEIVQVLNEISKDLSEMKNVIDKIRKLATKLGAIDFLHCQREENAIAHCVSCKVVEFSSHSRFVLV